MCFHKMLKDSPKSRQIFPNSSSKYLRSFSITQGILILLNSRKFHILHNFIKTEFYFKKHLENHLSI